MVRKTPGGDSAGRELEPRPLGRESWRDLCQQTSDPESSAGSECFSIRYGSHFGCGDFVSLPG